MIKKSIYSIAYTLLIITGCSRPWAEVRREVKNGWQYADSLEVPFTVQDTMQKARITVGVAITDEYAYSNLYMLFAAKTPGGGEQQSKVQLVLADSAGTWYARRKLNGTYSMQTVLNPKAHFAQSGKFALRLKHYMRPDTLKGVAEIWVAVETAD